MDNDFEQTLQDGINAARRGDRNTGRRLLQEVIDQDPDNELAWIWMASCVTTLAERRNCLERVLEINPNNARARQALEALGTPARPAQPAGPSISIDRVRQAQRQAAAAPQPQTRRGGGINLINIAIGILFVIAVVGGLLLFSEVGIGNQNNRQAALPTRTPAPPPSRTPTPFPTREPVPFVGTSGAPTLPPTFTPTVTPLPSHTPTPTSTPYPLSEFRAVFTSLEEGAPQPAIYFMRGDGSEQNWFGDGFRDVVFDPSGQRIAFVRDVEYPPAEEGGEPEFYPELFIAPINDLNSAVQITQIKAAVLSSPTWSPEGNALVFVNDYNGSEDLWYITPDGENLRRLTLNDAYVDRDPAWEPVLGSRRIVFASDQGSFGSTELYSFEITEPGVDLVYRQLTNSNNSSYSPMWAYDGSKIAFISDRSGDADVYIMNPDGSGPTLLTRDDGEAEDRKPAFTPDARYVAFISNRQDDRFQIYMVSLQGDVLVRLTTHERNDQSIVFRPELILRLRQ